LAISVVVENDGRLAKVTHPIYEGVDAQFPNLKGTYLSGGAATNITFGSATVPDTPPVDTS